jgi:hypothetical protein
MLRQIDRDGVQVRPSRKKGSCSNATAIGVKERSWTMRKSAKKYEVITEDLGDGRSLRITREDKRLYSEILKDGKLLQRNRLGTMRGKTLILDVIATGPGDGRVRLPRPCPKCGCPMQHRPNECTNWLPNGSYWCGSCGCHWVGTPGIVEEEAQQESTGSSKRSAKNPKQANPTERRQS